MGLAGLRDYERHGTPVDDVVDGRASAMTGLHRRHSSPPLAALALCGLVGEVTAQGSAATDRAALEALYDATGGPGWTDNTNWKTAAPLDDWHGVATDAGGRVVGVNLFQNGLAGPLPPALGSLGELQWLYLTGNALTGGIPDALRSLAKLEGLSLHGNPLDSGPVPAWLGNLTELTWLHLGYTSRTGPIPGELGNLVNLEWLYLEENDLTGPVTWLANLANLQILSIGGNWGLSGRLPPGLSQSHLEQLNIFFTQVCAPGEWAEWLATIEFNGRLCGSGTDVAIDVAAVYTPAARVASGGVTAIEAVMDLMVADANQAYAESGVHHRIRLVERSEVQYVETGDSLVDLNRLAGPSDGYMDEVHDLRDRAGGDLVHLIVGESDFSRADLEGAFGLSIHSHIEAFAHETGHNMGLRHDRYLTHYYEGGTLRSDPAYGYVNQQAFEEGAPASSRWRTIMAGIGQCQDADFLCVQLRRFSNPRQDYQGDPLGIAYPTGGSGLTGPADATAVLNATGPAVALWRNPPARANRPPMASGTLPAQRLTLAGTFTVDVSSAFVDPDGNPLTYTVSSSAPDVVTVLAVGARVTLTAIGEGTATIRVTATDPGGLSAAQSLTVTVTAAPAPFTDDPIRPGVTPIKAVHFTELRARIDALRSVADLARFSWTDPVLQPGVTRVQGVHLLELRTALAEAYRASGRAAPRWTDPSPAAGSTPIRVAHVTELRAAVLALE